MKQRLSNTKKSLGRVWFRYFQLYGMTGKLAIACMDIGWTQTDMDTYTREHYHLVNQQMANSTFSEKGDQECLGHDFLMSRYANRYVSSKSEA